MNGGVSYCRLGYTGTTAKICYFIPRAKGKESVIYLYPIIPIYYPYIIPVVSILFSIIPI